MAIALDHSAAQLYRPQERTNMLYTHIQGPLVSTSSISSCLLLGSWRCQAFPAPLPTYLGSMAAVRHHTYPLTLQTPFHISTPRQHGTRHPHLVIPHATPACTAPPAHTVWAIWTLLCTCAAAAQLVEQHTGIGKMLSAPLLSMLLGAAASTMGVVPTACVQYDIVWEWLMPMAAALYLLESNLAGLIKTARPVLMAFMLGAVGTVLGTVVSFRLVGDLLGSEGPKMAAALCASYIGGSINFAATAQALGLVQRGLLAACMTADNLAMGLYLSAAMVVPVGGGTSQQGPVGNTSQQGPVGNTPQQGPVGNTPQQGPVGGDRELYSLHGGEGHSGSDRHRHSGSAAAADNNDSQGSALGSKDSHSTSTALLASPTSPTSSSISAALAAAALACSMGWWVSHVLHVPAAALTLTALACAGLAAVVPNPHTVFAGATTLGGCLMGVFFATIGCTAGLTSSLAQSPALFAFIIMQLLVHMVVTLGVGRGVLGLPIKALLIASNANVGGPATAAAMAASRGWPEMVQPAMMVGGLGYAIGTAVGVYVGRRL